MAVLQGPPVGNDDCDNSEISDKEGAINVATITAAAPAALAAHPGQRLRGRQRGRCSPPADEPSAASHRRSHTAAVDDEPADDAAADANTDAAAAAAEGGEGDAGDAAAAGCRRPPTTTTTAAAAIASIAPATAAVDAGNEEMHYMNDFTTWHLCACQGRR